MEEQEYIEKKYRRLIKNVSEISSDSILEINNELIESFNNQNTVEDFAHEEKFFFHVIEGKEKLTLFNEELLIWILPKKSGRENLTYVLLAKNGGQEEGKLELVLSASGIYNSSKLILQAIEHLIVEMRENEECMHRLQIVS